MHVQTLCPGAVDPGMNCTGVYCIGLTEHVEAPTEAKLCFFYQCLQWRERCEVGQWCPDPELAEAAPPTSQAEMPL